MQGKLSTAAFVVGLLLYTSAHAQTGVIVVKPDDVKWAPAAGLPDGWKSAMLEGDSTKAGPYVQRIRIPPNAMVPPHTHPDDENITVLTGAFGIAEGRTADKSKGRILPAGSFYHLPANTAHFAWTGTEGADIQIDGIGPSGMTMVK